MKSCISLGLLVAAAAFAQTETNKVPAPNGPAVPMAVVRPDTVVAEIDGRKMTAGELETITNSFPGLKQNLASDPRTFLERFGVLMTLSKMAESNGLDKQSPQRERIEYARMQVLWQAQIDRQYNQLPVTPEEVKTYYEANKDRFASVKIKAIYIPFSAAPPPQKDPNAKKVLGEAEALAQAQSVMKQAQGGADFVKLVKQYSQDPTSAGKDGDFGTFKQADKIPDHIKKVIFALKTGEVSEPVKQPNGYYVFRAEEAIQQSLAQAQNAVMGEIRDKKLQEWLQGIGKSTQVKIENEAYFGAKAAKPVAK